MPKIVPKSLQKCFEHVLGQTFRKNFFAQCSLEVRVFGNFQKKNIFKIPKMPKSVPKSIQTCFRVIFSKKILYPVFHGGSSFRKLSKIFFFKTPKMPKIVPKSLQTCFEHVLGQTFRKIFAQFSMECRVFENFQKKIFSRFQKCPKVFPKVSKRVLG